ncbi:MAG TPA: transglycosylase SLT domain-containing protein [Hyphomicrobiales bacterium]|nr:transglycosylase SLT domain-containing protein [Hyphomicrobiales bacterium]
MIGGRDINQSIAFNALIQQACEQHLPGLDWRVLKAQLYAESRLIPRAASPAGAQGIAQFMPATWAEIAPQLGFGERTPWEPEAAIPCAAFYMARLWREWTAPRPVIDRYLLALASYNAGLGSVLKAQETRGNPALYADIIKGLPTVTGARATETITYVRRIMQFYAEQVLGFQ